MTDYDEEEIENDLGSYEHDAVDEDEDLLAALAAEWGTAPWYVSSIGAHLILFLILFLIPLAPELEPERAIEIKVQIVENIVEKEDEKPDIDIEPKEDKPVIEDIADVTFDMPIITETDIEITDEIQTDDEVADETAAGDPEEMSTFDSEFTGTPADMGVGASGNAGGGKRFGNRGRGGRKKALRRGKGNDKTEKSVTFALEWLAAHQESDGSWSCSKYGGSGKHGKDAPGDTRKNGGDMAVTGLAMLAFLGAGNSVGFGTYKNNVRRGVEWMMSQQNANGSMDRHSYVGGIGLMAIAETYGMSEGHPMAKAIGISAQKAVDWAVKTQNANGSFDYRPNSSRSDQSVTGWWVMGLKSAYVSGLNVPDKTFKKAQQYHRMVTLDDGRSAYGHEPGKGSIRMSAVANTCLQFLGDLRTDKKVVSTAKRVTVARYLPSAKTDDDKDFYLMYYQALGLFQMGVRSKYWNVFNEGMKTHLLGTQVKDGAFAEKRGSWNYEGDAFGLSWGRVGQTALGALMFEVYYRYKPNSKVGKGHR